MNKSINFSCGTRMGALRIFGWRRSGPPDILPFIAALQQLSSQFRVQCPEEGLVPNESYVSQT